uniref:Uncharacterized protein n=1 Tax=Timema shepardi TaxID=629360 RepID=A0A7R9G3T1_TIMSH|nr:unnamed protein product [Timema shepardi]
MPSVAEFFPSIENDLTKVTWAHKVNSNVALQKALENQVIHHLSRRVSPLCADTDSSTPVYSARHPMRTPHTPPH